MKAKFNLKLRKKGARGRAFQGFPEQTCRRSRKFPEPPARFRRGARLTWRWLITGEFPPATFLCAFFSRRKLELVSPASEGCSPARPPRSLIPRRSWEEHGAQSPLGLSPPSPASPKHVGCETWGSLGVSGSGRGGPSRESPPPYPLGENPDLSLVTINCQLPAGLPFRASNPELRFPPESQGLPASRPRPRTPAPGASAPGTRRTAPLPQGPGPPTPRPAPQAHPVGVLGEPVHLLGPPRHGCSLRTGERAREDAAGPRGRPTRGGGSSGARPRAPRGSAAATAVGPRVLARIPTDKMSKVAAPPHAGSGGAAARRGRGRRGGPGGPT